jgi:hypothetical protein
LDLIPGEGGGPAPRKVTHGEARIHAGLEPFEIIGSKYHFEPDLCHFDAEFNLAQQKVKAA